MYKPPPPLPVPTTPLATSVDSSRCAAAGDLWRKRGRTPRSALLCGMACGEQQLTAALMTAVLSVFSR